MDQWLSSLFRSGEVPCSPILTSDDDDTTAHDTTAPGEGEGDICIDFEDIDSLKNLPAMVISISASEEVVTTESQQPALLPSAGLSGLSSSFELMRDISVTSLGPIFSCLDKAADDVDVDEALQLSREVSVMYGDLEDDAGHFTPCPPPSFPFETNISDMPLLGVGSPNIFPSKVPSLELQHASSLTLTVPALSLTPTPVCGVPPSASVNSMKSKLKGRPSLRTVANVQPKVKDEAFWAYRTKALARYREKRGRRVWKKKRGGEYMERKKVAKQRPRIGGRFVSKSKQKLLLQTLAPTSAADSFRKFDIESGRIVYCPQPTK